MAQALTGFAGEWLAAHRAELNGRFRLAQRRYPRLEGARVLELLAEILPPLAVRNESGTPQLLKAVYELVLLHAGRGLLGERRAGIQDGFAGTLLREVFPRLLPLLVKKPLALTGALSNAAENLGERGAIFAQRMGELGAGLNDPEHLLDAGVFLAWRMGEPRLRKEAFIAGAKLPAQTVLAALDLSGWPEAAAVPVLTALQADTWRAPETLFKPETIERLDKAGAKELQALQEKLALPPEPVAARWGLARTVGDFSGYGGVFDEPPLLLAGGTQGQRHRLWVLSTEGVYRIETDLFGWVCVPEPAMDMPVQEVRGRTSKLTALLKGKTAAPQLYPDGRLEAPGAPAVELPEAVGAATFACGPAMLAFTLPESFRVRVMTPVREAL